MLMKRVAAAIVGLALLTTTNYGAFRPKEDVSFCLEDTALKAIITTKSISPDDIKLLEQAKESMDYSLLPTSFIRVIEQNVVWTLVRKFGLEQKKVNLNTCMQMPDFDKTLLEKMTSDYQAEFKSKFENIPDAELCALRKNAISTAIDSLIAFSKTQKVSTDMCSVFEVTDENKKALIDLTRAMYEAEGCGICGKSGGSIWWTSPQGRCVHQACYTFISNAEDALYEFMESAADHDNGTINFAHADVVKAVQKACGRLTILEYAKQNGLGALKKLFDTVGKEAFLQYVEEAKK
jgi:hypothetical protein